VGKKSQAEFQIPTAFEMITRPSRIRPRLVAGKRRGKIKIIPRSLPYPHAETTLSHRCPTGEPLLRPHPRVRMLHWVPEYRTTVHDIHPSAIDCGQAQAGYRLGPNLVWTRGVPSDRCRDGLPLWRRRSLVHLVMGPSWDGLFHKSSS